MPVQPVWCDAPIPAPVSPWKYSWNQSRSCQSGSVWNFSYAPNTGRRPFSSSSQMETRRWAMSSETSRSRTSVPDPVGYSTRKSSPRNESQFQSDTMVM